MIDFGLTWRWVKMIWPLWAVQFALVALDFLEPDMTWFLIWNLLFGSLAFFLAWVAWRHERGECGCYDSKQ